ncbi:hypothetical protein J2S57_001041 [Kineosporia succinea]|uniref:Uncharacterized protein n=1 Tax=Kineosporia succinea TaxID=84632 RepID=A0ABT9NXZ3_9ACTN|nr:hypothetical protein [Kineosporia succinea]
MNHESAFDQGRQRDRDKEGKRENERLVAAGPARLAVGAPL